ncbi:MAG: hypothetical protein HOV68_26915, partial [Streptomycetaceae bacterium]|nr:hypothetical protein [Streptomycetaceae bacterium]
MSAPDHHEDALCLRVLDAFLREDIHGLCTRGRRVERRDGRWLGVRSGHRTAELPVRTGTFLCELTARAPYLVEDAAGGVRRHGSRRIVKGLDPIL